MPKSPKKQREEFLAPLQAWLKAALEAREYSFSSVEEELEWIKNQDRVIELGPEFERILIQIPDQWNAYCKRFRDNLHEASEKEEEFLKVPKGKAGAPRKFAQEQEAVALHQAGKNFPQIAAELSNKFKEEISSEAVRKKVERSRARTKSKKKF